MVAGSYPILLREHGLTPSARMDSWLANDKLVTSREGSSTFAQTCTFSLDMSITVVPPIHEQLKCHLTQRCTIGNMPNMSPG